MNPLIKDFNPRLYQETILASASQKNTLVVIPTGLGKTAISMLLAAQRVSRYPKTKVLILAPTRPLVEQHYKTFQKHLNEDENQFTILTGFIKPEIRAILWEKTKYIFSTPQGLENDILSGKIKLDDVSLIVFDECHRAVGDYSYVFIAEQYNKQARYPLILGLTASPGSDIEKISEVCKNLFIEGIEARNEEDPDVKDYVQEIDITTIYVELPEEFKKIKKFLEACIKSKLEEIKQYGLITQINDISRKDLISLQGELQGQLAQGIKDIEVMKSVSLTSEAMKVHHALELLESQGIPSLANYFDNIWKDSEKTKVKAVINLVRDINFRSARVLTDKLNVEGTTHPKLLKLIEIITEEVKEKGKKVIVFNQFRDSAQMILNEISKIEGVKSVLFVGQAMKGGSGLTQKKQVEILEKFREGEFNVVIMTSVGEEGLDIPRVDLVVFYEPIPSAIRQIQRRGRTGRQEKGRVILLVAKGTRDEVYKWAAHHKEKRMKKILNEIQQRIQKIKNPQGQKKLEGYDKEKYEKDQYVIYADHREKASGIIKELYSMGLTVKLDNLSSADYILSSRAGVEFKTAEDFIDSILDGRLLQQIKWLKENFQRPLLIIEGERDLYSVRNIHPNAIRGMIATITVSYGIPLLQTKNHKETASILAIIAKREQDENGKDFSYHTEKKGLNSKEQQEYIVSSLPGIGGTLTKPLLKKFKTVRRLINASEEKLKEVEMIGEEKARKIREILDKEYEE